MGRTAVIGWTQPQRRLIIVQRPDAITTKDVPTWCSLSHERVGLTEVQMSGPVTSLITEVPLSPLLAILRAIEVHSVGRLIIRADGILLLVARTPSSLAEASISQLREGQPGVYSHRLQTTILWERGREQGSGPPSRRDTIVEPTESMLLREPVIPQPAISVSLTGSNELRQLLGRLGRQGLVTLSISKPRRSDHQPMGEMAVDLCWTVAKPLMSVTMSIPSMRALVMDAAAREGEEMATISVTMEQLQRTLFHASLLPSTSTVLAVIPEHVLILSVSVGSRDPLAFGDLYGGEDGRRNRITYFVPAASS